MRSLKIYLILGLAILLIGFSFGCKDFCGPDPPPPPPPPPPCDKYPPVGKIGDLITSCYYTLKVEKVEKAYNPCGTPPVAGNYYLIISITVKNVGATQNPWVSWTSFKLIDAQSNEYSTSGRSTYCLPDNFKESMLPLNQETSGKIGFEIPESSSGLILYFKAQYQADSEIKVDLGI